VMCAIVTSPVLLLSVRRCMLLPSDEVALNTVCMRSTDDSGSTLVELLDNSYESHPQRPACYWQGEEPMLECCLLVSWSFSLAVP